MPYIPQKHEKYNLLPYCRKDGGEVLDYPSELIHKEEKMLEDEYLMPYNFDSYEKYYGHIDDLIKKHEEKSKISLSIR
jgi:hypothetical protein